MHNSNLLADANPEIEVLRMLRKWFSLIIAMITIIPLTASTESVDMDGNHNEVLGEYGIIRKDDTGSTYSLTVINGNGFAAWASKLLFWPPPTQELKKLREKYPFYTEKLIFTCSEKDYETVQVGELIDIQGTLDEPYITQHKTGQLKHINRNLGPMIYHPDGLITWLYRDLD